MSRTVHNTKGSGYEYWKSRCPKADWHGKPGRETKKRTVRILRRKSKEKLKGTTNEHE
jgi:hypothetical protein